MKLSIIIPAYNEEKTIAKVIDKVKKQGVFDLSKEIIVVNDGSLDRTGEIIREISGIKIVDYEKNKGKGFAVRQGLAQVTGDLVLIQDADLELVQTDYPALVKPILSGKTDVVYGSRLLGGKIPEHTLFFYWGGLVVTFLTNVICGTKLTDEPCGYRVFKSPILKSLGLRSNGFEWEREITAKLSKKKIKIIEVPVKYQPRSVEEGKKVKLKDGFYGLWALLKYRF